MEPFPQPLQAPQMSNAIILLKINQLRAQYAGFNTLLTLSPAQAEMLNIERFHFVLLGLQQSISSISYINDPESRLSFQNKITANLKALENYFESMKQFSISSPQLVQEFAIVQTILKELKDMLTHANLLIAQAVTNLANGQKNMSKRSLQTGGVADNYDENMHRARFT